jgi:hypothetical protein
MSATAPGLDVLNIGSGHLKFRFDKADPAETEKAKKVITDMLRRGYMLFVLVDGEQKRVREFDPEREEYILEEPEAIAAPDPAATPASDAAPAEKRRRGRPRGPGKVYRGQRIAMGTTRATGIGPTAGG